MSLIVDNKYRLISQLGVGGYSEVYLAEGEDGTRFAIKLLKASEDSEKNNTVIEGFKNEFSILKELKHPNIASILDFGFDTENSRYYFTTELVEGQNIFDRTKESSPDEVLQFFLQLLRALEYLHSYHIYHFDIKAGNCLTLSGNKPVVKLIDFGLSCLNPKGKIIGTPNYMAPEIVMKEGADGRADIYSLGVLWYYCLARINPFRGIDMRETLDNQLHKQLPPISRYNPEVPEYLDTILGRMLQKNPADRYTTAASVIRDLSLFAGIPFPKETKETLLAYIPDEGRFVGRTSERARLSNIISSMLDGSLPFGLVIVNGSAGCGKSRLIKEMKYEAQLKLINTRTLPINDTTQTEDAIKQLSKDWSSLEKPEIVFMDPADLSLSDEDTLKILLSVILKHQTNAPASPATLVVGLRSEISAVGALRPLANLEIRLSDFTEDELDEYLKTLTGLDHPPRGMLQFIHSCTGGNPLLTTELVRNLIQNGRLFDRSGRWSEMSIADLSLDVSHVSLDQRPSQILLSSFKQQTADTRTVAETLAIFRRSTTITELESIIETHDLQSSLLDLIRAGIIIRGEGYTFAFRNPLLMEAVYNDIPRDVRESLHQRIADHLLKNPTTEEERLHHLSRTSDPKIAFEALCQLAQRHLESGRGLLAAECLEFAATIPCPHNDIEISELHLKLGEAYLIARHYAEALEHFDRSEASITSETKDTDVADLKIDSLIRIGGTYLKMEELGRARRSLSAAKNLLKETAESDIRRLIVTNLEAAILAGEGALDDAAQTYREARSEWKALAPSAQKLVTNNDLAGILLRMNRLDEARVILNEDLSMALERCDDLARARALYQLSQYFVAMQNLERAVETLRECAAICQEIHDFEFLLRVFNELGNAYLQSNDLDEAWNAYLRALSLTEQIADLKRHAAISVNLAIIANTLGRFDEGRQYLLPAISFLRKLDEKTMIDWQTLARGLIELADIARHQERKGEHRQAIDEVHEIIETQHFDTQWHTWLEEVGGERFTPDHEETDMELKYATLLAINRDLHSHDSMADILKAVLSHAVALSNADAGVLWVPQERQGWTDAASLGPNQTIEELKATPPPPDMLFGEISITEQTGYLTLLIRGRSGISGVLYLKATSLTEQQIRFMNVFAEQAAIAIDRGHQIDQLAEESVSIHSKIDEMSSQLKRYQEIVESSTSSASIQTGRAGYEAIIGKSHAITECLRMLDKVTDTDLGVYIYGESGTGKELVAKALHYNSSRKNRPFVVINCGAIPSTLIESELFGYRAGAFTGATRDKPGLIEQAEGGTLFLDEIAEMDASLQVKLLRAIQEKEVMRLGDTKSIKYDLRFICASNKDLLQMTKENKFREDLYWRICQIRVNLPPLRERKEDLPLLIKAFLKKAAPGKDLKLAPPLLKRIFEYDWPGNIRELESLIAVLSVLAEKETIDLDVVPRDNPISKLSVPPFGSQETRRSAHTQTGHITIDELNKYDPSHSWWDYERVIFAKAYEACHFNAREAAKMLNVSAATMYKKVSEDKLQDSSNPLYKNVFRYTLGKKLKEYIPEIFTAALKAHEMKPGRAISALGISPGYFYKILKKARV